MAGGPYRRWVSGDGWRKCVWENGVQEFDFVVVKHQGNMVFDLLVFDPSTCEKQYPNPSGKIDVEEPLTESESEKEEENCRLGDDRCFVSKITPYYIKSSRLASVPMQFARSNRLITKTKVIIRHETRRTWPATLKNTKMRIRLLVCHEFRLKINLKIGDTCMFELVKRGKMPIFDFYSRSQVILNYYISSLFLFQNLPIHFMRSNGLNIGKIILRDDKSRSWEVMLKEMSGIRFYHGCGFKAFLVDNKLKEGDAFKSELVENEKKKPPVAIFSCKSRVAVNSHRKEICVPKEEDDDHPRPYFVGKLKSYNFRKSLLMHLPNEFAKKNGLFNNGEIILRNGKDERSWIIELRNQMTRYCYIGRGWKDFCVANGLKEGDSFKFEIVDKIGEKLVVNFYILKNPSRLS